MAQRAVDVGLDADSDVLFGAITVPPAWKGRHNAAPPFAHLFKFLLKAVPDGIETVEVWANLIALAAKFACAPLGTP